jgi:hypothetical protein
MGLGLKEKLRPSKRRRRLSISSSLVSLVPIRSEESRQDWYFAETPEEYPVGQHGLLILHTPPPEHLQQLPPLPPATEGVAYGVSRTVQFDDGLHPGDLILINHFLDEPLPEYPPSQSSRKQKFCRKLYQAKAFLQNPRADPQFPYLPRGMNNRIRQNRDPIFHKVRRLYRRLRKSFLKIIGQSTQNTPAIRPQEPVPAPYLRRLPGGYPAPERYCPQVNPTKILDPGSAFDQCGNPFGGEFQVFHETAEERKVRADRCLTERYWRRASDQRLNLEGRQQLKEPLIGKAPPLSRRQLLAPLKIKAARAKKDQRDFFKVKPLAPIPDIDPKDLPLPKENDRPSQWDRVFLANKTPPKVPAGEEIELQAFMVRVPSNSSLIEKILQDSSLQDSSPQDSSLQDPQPAYPVLAVLPASSEQPTNPPQRQTPIPKQPIAGDSDDLYNVSDREIERQRANTNLRLNQLHLEPQVDRAENRSGSVSVFSQQSHPELPNLEEDEQLRQGPREESQPLEQQVHQVQEHSAITPPIPPATFNTSKNTKASAPTDTESRKPFREPFQSDSDYTEAAPSNKYSDVPPYSNPLKPKDEDDEELRIIRGRAIATQNSAYYNERYAEERRIREGKLIAQRNTEYFAHLYHPHPHNIVTPASSQTVPSPFESASPGRRAVWNDAELALDGKKKIPPSDARSREQKERPETMDFATFLYEQTNSQVDRVPERSRRVHHRRREERPEAVGFATLPFQQTSSQANKVPERSRRVHHRRREERPETVDFATLPFQQTSSQANRVPERSNRGPGSREERPEAVGFATPQFEQTASEAQRIPEHRRRNQSREERQHALSFATLPELERHISNSHFEETELQSHPGFGTSQLEFTHLQHNQVLVSAVDRKEDFKEASKDRRAGRDIAAFDSQQHQAHTPLFPYQQSQNGYQNLRPRGRASGVFPFDPKSRRIDGTPIDPLQIDPDVWPDRSAGGFFVQEPLEKNWDQTAPLPNRCFLGHILPGRRQELNANSENHSAQEQGAENRIQNRPLDRADGTVSRTRSRFESSGPVTETATAIVENNNGDPPRQRVKQSDQDTLVSHTRTAFEIVSCE